MDGRPCPRDGCTGTLKLAKSVVTRGVVVLEDAQFVHGHMRVALSVCDGKKRRHTWRVLPGDVLARKTYAVGAQEVPQALYLEGGRGLRKVVSGYRGERPHHSTLWGWLKGLGRYALGRDTTPGGVAAAAVREETRKRQLAEFDAVWARPVAVDPARYRSDARRKELEAALRWLCLARVVVPDAGLPLAAWCCLAAGWFAVATLGWWGRPRSTRIQHRDRTSGRLASAAEDRCPTHTRSPPGDSR